LRGKKNVKYIGQVKRNYTVLEDKVRPFLSILDEMNAEINAEKDDEE
jgi:hypothetical protein